MKRRKVYKYKGLMKINLHNMSLIKDNTCTYIYPNEKLNNKEVEVTIKETGEVKK